MGRKIPGKKHRGVKDPNKQRALRLAQLDAKTNAPPRDADEQLIPKSLEKVIELKEAVKSGRIAKRKRRRRKSELICVGGTQNSKLHPKAKREKVVPVFRQKPGETAQEFMNRVNRETHAFLSETEFEKKYGVQVDRDPESGEITGLSKREKDDIDIEALRAKHKNIRKRKSDVPHLSKSQKRRRKVLEKKERKLEEQVEEFEDLRDEVKFGEVAHEPPSLRAKPAKASNTSKPAQRNLLLKSLFEKDEGSNAKSGKSVAIDRSGKRKNLPAAERRQLEKQQNAAIVAYRMLKASRVASD